MNTRMGGIGGVVRAACLVAAVAGSASAMRDGDDGHKYTVTAVVSDGSIPTPNTDSHLVNAWGIAFNPAGFVWVADNGTGFSTLYDGNGVPQSLVVQIASPTSDPAAPTGIVFSGGNDFQVTNGTATAPARFMFATEDGLIAGWAPQVDTTHALRVAGDEANGAVYKGLALGTGRIFATDFHNNKVDVFDGTFAPVALGPNAFKDSHLPRHFAPFGIQAIDGNIFVTFAKQDADAHDEVDGRGLGAVDEFDQDGHLLMRVAAGGSLNAPWGLAVAPANFGEHSGQLLIGNFGDGRINAFELRHNRFEDRGALHGERGGDIRIDGLWGIAFGNGLQNQPVNTLFFAAGPGGEAHGVYGRIDVDNDHGHGHGH